MAYRNFRRFGSSRGRSFSSRFRGRRMQTPHEPRKWERANIYLVDSHLHDTAGGRDIVTVFILAQIYDRIMDPTIDPAGSRSLSQAVRYLEVGGIVGHYACHLEDGAGVQVQPGDLNTVHARMLLCSDRLDSASPPGPAALLPNWFTNTQPVASIAELQDDQQSYPTQIHHQESWNFIQSGFLGADLSGDLPFQVATERTTRTKSQRLRLRLSDQECLVLHFATHLDTSLDEDANLSIRMTFTGTMYYRFVFGRG